MTVSKLIELFEKGSSKENILLGIAASLIVIGFQQAYKFLSGSLNLFAASFSKGFTLGGYWLSITWLDDEKKEVKHIDIIELRHHSSDLSTVIWHYGSTYKAKKWYKYYGKGVQKGQNISLYYYLASKTYPETGCAILHLEGAKLVGPYVQYAVKDNDSSLFISRTDYCLRRINLSLRCRLKSLIRIAPFKDFDECLSYASENDIYYD